ncbi:MAG: heavy metal sensor histidine kinase [Alphaproteobacteria bacterium]
MNARSIHVRLTLWYTALIVATSIAFGAYTYSSLQHRLYEEMQGMLSRRIEHLREDVLPTIAAETPETLAHKIQEVYSPEENDRFIRISKPDGTVLYVSGVPREKTFEPTHIPLPRNYTKNISERAEELRTTEHLLLVGFVAPVAGNDYVLEMGGSTAPIGTALHKLIVTLLIGLPVIVLIAAAVGSVLVRRALQPVEAMRATAEQISFSNLRQRLPITATDDAIEQLSKTLNQMLERLDQAYQQASRFSADASHEIRTPLAIVRSELETIVQEQEISDALRERIGSILEEIERLSNIVEGLFSLARLDAGEGKVENDVVDLAELTRSTLEQMHLLAEERSLSVIVSAAHPVFVRGDAARLKQVVVNLLDNAIKYTMPGGTISIVVGEMDLNAILTVNDNGIGISSDALPHIFERFYRADKVRSSASQGAGLGLSIVYSICQAHGGTIRAMSQEGVGTTLLVKLPLVTKHNS